MICTLFTGQTSKEGILLLAESIFIFKEIIKEGAAILLVVVSIILGTIVTALICFHYSK